VLYQVYSDMYRDLQIAEDELLQFAAQKSSAWSASVFVLEDEFYLEGWLSFVWQTWCTFCRKCIVSSAMGTTTGSGHTIPSLAGATTEEFVSGAVIRVAKGKPLVWTANSALRIEPTWGDVDKLHDIVIGLVPNNSATLLSGITAASTAAKTFQTIRNAAAHRNHQTLADVNALRSRYVAFPITHPIHSLFWTSASGAEYLAIEALNEIATAGFVAIG
jgi:hypothetical protein